MSCHEIDMNIEIPPGARKIVLAGNPNVGKSVLFNAFTGVYVDVSNYPGTTLEISHGAYGQDVVIDTPGVYGISSFNDEEKIARDIILSADIVVNIVDAVHLERDLFLTQQIIDTGVPVIIGLNMMDECRRQGIEIDVAALSKLLGVPIVPTVAITKNGFDQLKAKVDSACPGVIDPRLQELVDSIPVAVPSQGEALLILEGDGIVAQRNNTNPLNHREEIYSWRRERVNYIAEQVLKETSNLVPFTTRLGRWMIRPITGVPMLLIVLWAMYKVIGVFVAGNVVNVTEGVVMKGWYEPFVKGLVAHVIAPNSAIGQILVGEFGVLTMTVSYILGLLLPLVISFYLVLSTFEDSGYLPRIATLADRMLTRVGLNGRAIIPIILGFGCVTMATITTRMLGSERERRIAIFLLAMGIPCSAQLGVIIALLAALPTMYAVLYVFVIFALLVFVGTLLNRMLSGESSDLLIDLPPLRLPRLKNVVQKTWIKSMAFVKEATPLFAAGALVISVAQVTGLLEVLQKLLAPITVGFLNLPKEASTAFIMGFVRRDFGAAGLSTMHLSTMQTLVGLITITIFVPCMASALVIFKERGKKETVVIWFSVLAIAFLVGGIIAQTYRLTGSIWAVFGEFALLLIGGMVIGNLPRKQPELANMNCRGDCCEQQS